MKVFNLSQKLDEIFEKYSRCLYYVNLNETYSYDQLRLRSNFYINELNQLGVTKQDIISIYSDKSFDTYALMVACLRCGVIYSHLDPSAPKSRNELIYNRLNPKAIFTDIKSLADEYIFLKGGDLEKLDSDTSSEIAKDSIAYIMFTSGSTGVPKGACISHDNILGFLEWSIEKVSSSPAQRFAQISPLYFDNSVFDFFTATFSGASLVPISKELLSKPMNLVDYIDSNHCNIWFSVPSLFVYLLKLKILDPSKLKNLKYILFGGEGFPKLELIKLYKLYSKQTKFINVYGPTEGTCICSDYDITDSDFKSLDGILPLGAIHKNFTYRVSNKNDSGVGELILIGRNVGLGYYNDERTEKSFNFCGFEREYNTGDLVYDEKGILLFKGRKDNQIKHMGYRIELEEIESIAKKSTFVHEVIASYKRVDVGYGKIFLFFSSKTDVTESVRSYLKENLPSYMQPNKIIYLQELPKNQNGKIDRNKINNLE